MSKIIDTQVEKARKIVEGLRNNQEALAAKGLSIDKLDELVKDADRVMEASAKTEAMRAECSAQVKRTNALLDELKRDYATFRNLIRNNYPQEEWIRFGLMDKR